MRRLDRVGNGLDNEVLSTATRGSAWNSACRRGAKYNAWEFTITEDDLDWPEISCSLDNLAMGIFHIAEPLRGPDLFIEYLALLRCQNTTPCLGT
jgi:hypothetical protein